VSVRLDPFRLGLDRVAEADRGGDSFLHVGEDACGDSSQERRAERSALLRRRALERQLENGRHDSKPELAPGPATGYACRPGLHTDRTEELQRVPQAERHALEHGADERAAVVAKREAGEGRARGGIDVRRAFTIVFALGGALAALAGVLSGVYFGVVDPGRGTSLLIFAFIVVVIGGFGSIGGSAIAAVAVGLIQQYANYYSSSGTGDLAVVLLLAAILLVRPGGLAPKVAH